MGIPARHAAGGRLPLTLTLSPKGRGNTASGAFDKSFNIVVGEITLNSFATMLNCLSNEALAGNLQMRFGSQCRRKYAVIPHRISTRVEAE
jgi:hypothetical protein